MPRLRFAGILALFTCVIFTGYCESSNEAVRNGAIIPTDRLYEWGAYCGVPGGIPDRATIYRTLTVANTTAEINAAIAACPENQVVYLAAGTYRIGQIDFGSKHGITLRGAGAGETIIQPTATPCFVNTDKTYAEASGIDVVGGYTKDSTAITLASAPTSQFVAGNIIAITEAISPDIWGRDIGVYTRTTVPAGASIEGLNQYRCFRHMNRITSVVGNTINLAAPLPLDFSPSLNVKAYPPSSSGFFSLCGIEDLTIDCNNSVGQPIRFISADRCWVKDVEVKGVASSDRGQILIYKSFQCEVRRCYIHDVSGFPTQQDGYAVCFDYGASNCLLVDNIARRVASLNESNGAAANAYIYNYAMDQQRATYSGQGLFINHGPHGFMDLYEGNIVYNVSNDGYHGSGSHHTAFRNNINGVNSNPMYSGYWHMINLCRGSYYHTIVGNIIGDSSWTVENYDFPVGGSGQGVYRLGFPNVENNSLTPAIVWANYDAGYPDPNVAATLLRHGNYDYFSKATVWDDTISSRTIPNSLFYSTKPDYFGALQWPPIGPDVSGLVNAIPAKARWDRYLGTGDISDLFR